MKHEMREIAILAGDGVGPEIMSACSPLLARVITLGGHQIKLTPAHVGWAAFDANRDEGTTMPEATWDICDRADAILFGAVGLPGRDHELSIEKRPERAALLPLRQRYKLGTNIRPAIIYPGLEEISPLKNRLVEGGLSITCFRELNGDVYFGKRELDPNAQWAYDTAHYDRSQIESIARTAFEFARRNGKPVVSLDKANVVYACGTFWRSVVQTVRDDDYPDVPLRHEYIDAFVANVLGNPKGYPVVLTSNMFGDIASDQTAKISGSLGLMPSASLNPASRKGLYEPAAGSAPDIMGRGVANPIGMVLSIAMMLRHSLDDDATARRIEEAVQVTLGDGFRTNDLRTGAGDERVVDTKGMVAAILANTED